MIRPDFAKWGQTGEEMRRLSLESPHARTGERFQSLYMIGSGQKNASEWAKVIGRKNQTVHSWIHQDNSAGPVRLSYRRSGGNRPLFRLSSRPSSPEPLPPVSQVSTGCPATIGP